MLGYRSCSVIINSKGSDIKSNIKIDTSTVYKMQVSENGTIFEIYLDNGLDLRIEK